MKYKIEFAPQAETDTNDIGVFLAKKDFDAAEKCVGKIEASIALLSHSPRMGRQYKDYRKHVSDNYNIYYRLDEDVKSITIVRVIHHAMKQKIK